MSKNQPNFTQNMKKKGSNERPKNEEVEEENERSRWAITPQS